MLLRRGSCNCGALRCQDEGSLRIHPWECAYLIKTQPLAARIPGERTQKSIEFLGGVAEGREILAKDDDEVRACLFCFFDELQFVHALGGFSVLTQAGEGTAMQARFSFPYEPTWGGQDGHGASADGDGWTYRTLRRAS